MTERIYYSNPACLEFDAVVRQVLEHEGRPAVVLDRTAFYPSSGGQPFDTGTLGEADVVEVVDDGERVVHVLSAMAAEGMRVVGRVDRVRRVDHMQQHTGQHVLSAAFDRLFGNPTMSFHMGAEVSTIDLAREMSAAEIDRAAEEANRVVFENRPVAIRFVSEDEAARLPLRKEPARGGTLRLIEVSGFDLSACGGTHVARTGEIGLIAVRGAERFRGGGRITFVCGGRALRTFAGLRDAVSGVVRQLSVLPHELPLATERLQAEVKDLRKTVARLQDALAVHEAARLLAQATPGDGRRVIATIMDGWDAAGLKAIASALTRHDGVAAAIVSSATPVSIAVARSRDVAVDAGKVVRDVTAAFEGRGGGRPELAQGGGLSGAPADVLAAATQALKGAAT